eukprot:2809185-Amphidinium_carterae.1
MYSHPSLVNTSGHPKSLRQLKITPSLRKKLLHGCCYGTPVTWGMSWANNTDDIVGLPLPCNTGSVT